jgi:hypothetical protein
MALFAVTGINLHLQTDGGLFDMMDAKAAPVNLPGHGVTADGMLQAAAEAIPGARLMRISFWGGRRPVLVQMRFPEDHTPAGRSAVTLDPQTGRVLTAVTSRTAPVLYTALVQWNREIHTGVSFADCRFGHQFSVGCSGAQRHMDLAQPQAGGSAGRRMAARRPSQAAPAAQSVRML